MATEFETARTGRIMRISPEVAEAWMARNRENRRFSRDWARDLAQRMRAGEWKDNGEAIKFATDGRLLDGQHRLSAVAESGVTITARVEFGLPPEVFTTLDQGKKRNFADALSVKGLTEAPLLAATVTWLWRLETGRLEGKALNVQESLAYYDEHGQGLGASISASREAGRKLGRPSLLAALHFVFAQISASHADEFMALAGHGVGLGEAHPILTLRERLYADRLAKSKLDIAEVVAMFINAWNAFVNDRQIRVARGTMEGQMPPILRPGQSR